MNTTPVKTRFAPSPTGLLHLGNLRTALFSVLLARRHQGQFLLRIEDTDVSRSRQEYADALMGDLRWLGLDWQEGPQVGGDAGPYRQSERSEIYSELYRRLEQDGLAYPCFCSERELALVRKSQLSAGQPPRYPGTCSRLSQDEVAARHAKGVAPTLRFRVPAGRQVVFEDLVRGAQRFATDEIGDFIIRRADGTPAFFFSNAVDDSLMGVSHVLRGEDHLTNTPRQLLLLQALGMRAPTYGHISMIVGPDGSPLSKRHNSRSLPELREAGYLPLALLNYLARLGHYYADNSLMPQEQLAAGFEYGNLGSAPARFDESQLMHWQREAVAASDAATLWQWLEPSLEVTVPEAQREAFVEAVRHNIAFPTEADEWGRIIYAEPDALDQQEQAELSSAGPDFFSAALVAYAEHGANYAALMADLKARTGAKGKGLFKPLRLALTGRGHGPELAPMLALMAPAEVERRLAAGRELATRI